jgi:hypothetical protein
VSPRANEPATARKPRPSAPSSGRKADGSQGPALFWAGGFRAVTAPHYGHTTEEARSRMLALAGTGYGLIGLLVIVLLVVLIIYFARRA